MSLSGISGLVVPGPNVVYSSGRFKDSWDPHAGNVMDPGAVEAVTFANGRIYVGGHFHLVSNNIPGEAPLTGKHFAILSLHAGLRRRSRGTAAASSAYAR